MIAQRKLFIKGGELWTFTAAAKQGETKAKEEIRNEKRKFKARYLGQVLSDLQESGRQPLWKLEIVSKLVGLFSTIYV